MIRALGAIGLGLIYAFLLLPLVAVVAASLTAGELMRVPPQGLSLRWFIRFLESETFREALLLSLRVAATTVVVTVTLATLAALCHRALSRKLGAAFRVAMTLPLLLPELLTAIGLLFFLNSLGLGKTLTGLQIGHVVIAFPFAFLAIVAALEQVDPALEEASCSLGAGGFETFRRVVLPLALFDFLTYDFDPTAAAAATLSVIFALLGVLVIERAVGLRQAF